MFAAYCHGHRARVLLFPDNIRALVNHADGVEVRWQCRCGQIGISRFEVETHDRGGAA